MVQHAAGTGPERIGVGLDDPQIAGVPPGDRARAWATCGSASMVTERAPRP